MNAKILLFSAPVAKKSFKDNIFKLMTAYNISKRLTIKIFKKSLRIIKIKLIF